MVGWFNQEKIVFDSVLDKCQLVFFIKRELSGKLGPMSHSINLQVQGLRAIAVIAVVIYHAHVFWPELEKAFPGGYLGVDVFFVISGFVITKSILRMSQAGELSPLQFFKKRVRRLIPALVVLVSLVVASSSFFDQWSKSLGVYGIASTFGFSNFLFWQTDDYDSPALETNPLLHTWSLGLEEQFYLLLIGAFLITRKLPLKVTLSALALLSAMSLIFALTNWQVDSSASFYLLPARLWEFFLGVAVAGVSNFWGLKTLNRAWMLVALQALALGVIVASFFTLPLTIYHPGLQTIPVVLATAFLILSSSSGGWINQVLSAKPLVLIGGSSYSIYLYHWPLAVVIASTEVGLGALPFYFAGAILMGFLSKRFVEDPFIRGWSSERKVLRRAAVASIATLMSFTSVIGLSQLNVFASSRTESPQNQTVLPVTVPDATRDWWLRYARSNLSSICPDFAISQPLTACQIGDPLGRPEVFLVGDSHALSLLDYSHNYLLSKGRSGYFTYAPGCPFLPNTFPDRVNSSEIFSCNIASNSLLSLVSELDVEKVWLANRWDFYIGQGGNLLSDQAGGPFEIASSRELASFELARLLTDAQAEGVQVFVFDQAPHQTISPRALIEEGPAALPENSNEIEQWLEARSLPIEVHLVQQGLEDLFFARVESLSKRSQETWLVKNDNVFCRANLCPIGDAGGLFYFDDDHLSIYGVERLFGSPKVSQLLNTGDR